MRAQAGGEAWLSGWRLAAFYAALAVMVVVPVLAVQVPALGDFPNHLARIHILESLGTGSPLEQFYARQHRIVPYQAMDVIVGALRWVLPLYAAGRVFMALCLLVPVAAAACLRLAVQGRVGLLPAAAFLLSYNYLLARGLLDYLVAAGLAVALFALWLRLAGWPRWRRTALCACGLALVFLGHAYAGVAYCILVAGDQAAAAVRRRFRPPAVVALDWAAAGAQALPCVALATWFGASGSFGGPVSTQYGSLAAKIGAALTPIYFPAPPPVVAAFGLLPLAGLVLWGVLRARLAPALRGPAVAVALAAAAAPNVLFNAWATDMRLPIVLAMVLIAGMAPARPPGRRALLAASCVLVALVTLRAGSALVTLQALDMQASELRGLLLALPPGARLLVVDGDWDNAKLRVIPRDFTEHLALLATVDRDAFVPYLLSGATQVQVRAELASLASPNNRPIDMKQLWDGAGRDDVPGRTLPYGFGANIYWLGWPRKFDYVLVMHFGADPGPMPPVLRPVAGVPIAELYAVMRKSQAALPLGLKAGAGF